MDNPNLSSQVFDSPLGPMLLAASEHGLAAIRLGAQGDLDSIRLELTRLLHQPVLGVESPLVRKSFRQIQSFLDGDREVFTVPLDLRGTPFQRRVWEALALIPYGETRTYREVAESIGRPQSVRAVANACGRNPIPIVIPCHRVVASDGTLGGFSSGIALKRRLLAVERGSAEHLPLFELAESRDAKSRRRRRRDDTLERLPEALSEWIRSRLDDTSPTMNLSPMTSEAWVAETLEALDESDLSRLAESIAAKAAKQATPQLREVAEELVAAALTLSLAGHEEPSDLGALLRAAVLVDSPFFEVSCHRILNRGCDATGSREEVAAVLRLVLEGTVPATKRLRQRAVDLWSLYEQRDVSSPWSVTSTDDPSAVYAAHGLWREAIVMAENALTAGHGEPTVLLGRLSELHEKLGDFAEAHEAMLRLVAIDPTSASTRRLRELADRVHLSHAFRHPKSTT